MAKVKSVKEVKDEPLEKQLWKSADKLRKNIDAAEYKHVVVGLIFLKYISDSFEELFAKLQSGEGEYEGADPEDRDEYKSENIFFVPPEARWSFLLAKAKQPTIGTTIDAAMDAIEKENASLKGVLPKVFARQNLDPTSLGGLMNLIGNIALGDAKSRSADVLGHVFEYFLGEFALAEGKQGGQYFTPKAIVTLIVEMLEPYSGRVYDPACGSGGFFVQSEKFIEGHGGKLGQLSVYGQESNPTTWRLAAMNMAIRGIDFNFGKEPANSFTNDQHPDLRADFVMANPPFNISEWWDAKLEGDPRWKFGTPPASNANFAWLQHMLYHLAPNGSLALLLANGSMSSNSSGEGDIRRALVEADLVECMVALPGQLFTNTQIPACIWFLTKNKTARGNYRNRSGHTLFIDARKLGFMLDRVLRGFTDDDIARIADTFRNWKRGKDYQDIAGFCKSASTSEIAGHGHVLTPGRYVGAEEVADDGEPFEVKMPRLVAELKNQFAESAKLESAIQKNLKGLGYDF